MSFDMSTSADCAFIPCLKSDPIKETGLMIAEQTTLSRMNPPSSLPTTPSNPFSIASFLIRAARTRIGNGTLSGDEKIAF